MNLNQRLRDLRIAKKVDQETVSKFLSVSRSTYTKYETGQSKPNHESLIALSKYFDVSVDYLLGNSNDPRTTDTILKDSGLKRDPERGLTKEQLPKELQDLGVKYIQLAKEMQDEELDPEDVKKLIDIIKKHKK